MEKTLLITESKLSFCTALSPQLLLLAQQNKTTISHEERNKFTSLTSKKESSNEVCIEGGEVQDCPFLLVEL